MSSTVWSNDGQRIVPRLGPETFKTYQVVAPLSTHWRRATCEEVQCPHFLHGWSSTIDENTELGMSQAYYIRKESGRSFTEQQLGPRVTRFDFTAGQPCFARDSHKIRLEREELFYVKGGDWRGNPLQTRPRQHTRPEFWLEDFAEHQARIADAIEEG